MLSDKKGKKKKPEFSYPPFKGYDKSKAISASLFYRKERIGAITAYGKAQGKFTKDDLTLLSDIASQCAIAIANFRLNADIEQAYLDTIRALAMAVEAKDSYSGGHLERVAKYAHDIGSKLGLDKKTLQVLRDGAYIHDLGKIGVSDDVLHKVSPLNEKEMAEIKKHPVIGETILKPVRRFAALSDLVRHHQERLDGSGYPDGLKGDEIPLSARVLAVADVFDALTTNRPYRKAMSKNEAKDYLKKFAGVQFDRRVVEAFLEIV